MRVIVFDVEHGFCAFVKSPTGHTMLIDCGMGDSFSALKYICTHELNGTASYNGYPLTQLTISHPHDDHIRDIHRVTRKLSPAILLRQRYDWDEIKEPDAADGEYENLDHYAGWQETYCVPVVNPPNWGVNIQTFRLTPGEAKKVDEAKFVNNSSIVVVVTFKGTQYTEKFVFGGDVEEAGWSALLEQQDFRDAVQGVDFFVDPHHGHSSGFSAELFKAMGRPILNIVSAHSRDESVDSRYSKEDFAFGTDLNGEKRRMVSTRRDGSIFIDVTPEGRFLLHTYELAPNLEPATVF
jgi:beta-lactamase superfamily II metal-dependent hydrolase